MAQTTRLVVHHPTPREVDTLVEPQADAPESPEVWPREKQSRFFWWLGGSITVLLLIAGYAFDFIYI